jgi:C4-dicarboxylate transporter DctM subunit
VATSVPILPLGFVAGRMVAGVDHFVLLSVPFFVAAGILMDAAGVSRHILYLLRLGLGRVKGSLNVVTIVALYLFSGVSGSRTADIAAVGNLVMPEYRRQNQAAAGMAVVASGACMGETVPPSTELLIIAALANVSVAALFLAGFLPAVVLAITLALVAIFWAPFGFQSDDISRSRRDKVTALGYSLLALLLPIILLGGVTAGIATPTEVSSFAVLYALLLGVAVFRTVSLRRALTLAVDTAMLSGVLLFIFANASIMAWLVAVQSFPRDLTRLVLDLSGGGNTWMFLALTIMVLLVMGWLMEGLPALVIFIPLFMPTAQALGINLVHYAIVLAIAIDIGVTAPPFGLGLYTACVIGRVSVEEVTPHILKYLAVLVVGLLLIAFVPDITLALPRLFGLVR